MIKKSLVKALDAFNGGRRLLRALLIYLGLCAGSRKGRYPKEYRAWLLWEVLLPLIAPLAVFITLAVYWAGSHTPEFMTKALVSISGSGDLMVFAAFLLINAAAKFRNITESEGAKDFVIEGELDGDVPFWWAIVLLLIYMGFRIALEIMDTQVSEALKFMYGAISFLLLVWVVVRLDCKVRTMYMRLLQRKANNGLVANYYNV